jgi:hypothetical protein
VTKIHTAHCYNHSTNVSVVQVVYIGDDPREGLFATGQAAFETQILQIIRGPKLGLVAIDPDHLSDQYEQLIIAMLFTLEVDAVHRWCWSIHAPT